jgi:hypothetical protein
MPDSYDQTKIDHSQIVLRRMIDANANRVAEGLRTLEDVARFTGLSNLQSQYKSVRHALQESIDAIGIAGLVSARDAHGDVGRETKTPSEKDRSHGIASIVAAAGSRVEQGLRVIEESCKVFTPSVWPPIEKLRYRVYDLNAALQLACQRDLAFLRQAKLYVQVAGRIVSRASPGYFRCGGSVDPDSGQAGRPNWYFELHANSPRYTRRFKDPSVDQRPRGHRCDNSSCWGSRWPRGSFGTCLATAFATLAIHRLLNPQSRSSSVSRRAWGRLHRLRANFPVEHQIL